MTKTVVYCHEFGCWTHPILTCSVFCVGPRITRWLKTLLSRKKINAAVDLTATLDVDHYAAACRMTATSARACHRVESASFRGLRSPAACGSSNSRSCAALTASIATPQLSSSRHWQLHTRYIRLMRAFLPRKWNEPHELNGSSRVLCTSNPAALLNKVMLQSGHSRNRFIFHSFIRVQCICLLLTISGRKRRMRN